MKIMRWKAIVPLLLVLVLIGIGYVLYSDTLVEHTIESLGADLVGAKVDLDEADLSLREGRVRLVGLAAANPNAPMRNLVEASEIIADVRVLPLLEKKVVIEQASFRGVRFGTERAESGELENPSPESGRLLREISGWADRVRIPPLNLDALNAVVNVDAVSIDSLTTVSRARGVVAFADSVRTVWEQNLSQLNPAQLIDTARALVDRLNRANALTLGLAGITDLANSSRSVLTSLTSTTDRLSGLDSNVRVTMNMLTQNVTGLVDDRAADYAYARRLLRLPSLDAPDLSASLFGDMAVARLEPVLYWVNQAERYLPPGLNPRRYPGPKRPRRAGVTVTFPKRDAIPKFLVESADADLAIGGEGVAAGAYAAALSGVTTEPAIYGQPLRAMVQRSGATVGPTDIRVNLALDHTGSVISDSGSAYLNGIPLPQFALAGSRVNVDLGTGSTELSLARTGDSLVGQWTWRSNQVRWSRGGGSGERRAEGGEQEAGGVAQRLGAFAEDFLWQAIASLEDVEITVRFSGSPRGPSLRIGSNVGRVVAANLRRELGERIEQAEQQVRQQVNRLVDQYVTEAESRVAALESEVAAVVGVRLSEVVDVRTELERAIRRVIPRP
ncbi:MAG: hypothetical protein JSW71_01245 [Gemmatimonadota bacterium]|nr:MAG: hypothetical protein JSW71_01245 [Gemmatimonadota bacterium]